MNDASALLIYRIAVLAVVSGVTDFAVVVPMSLLSILGSAVLGYALRPILSELAPQERFAHFDVALIVLGITIVARFIWVFS